MSEFITSFVKKNLPQFNKYKKYIQNNDWSNSDIDENLRDEFFIDYLSDDIKKNAKAEMEKFLKQKITAQKATVKYKSDEFKLQQELINSIIDRIRYFAKKVGLGDRNKPQFKKFIKQCLAVIDVHTDRTDEYVNSFDIESIENQDVRAEEIKLLKDCFSGLTSIKDKITELNIEENSQETNGIEFLNNMKAPLSMHKVLIEIYPDEIQKVLDAKGIDFDCDPGNDLHIYNPTPPVWDSSKHYWEQEKNTLQYYVNEFKKLENGILIDDYFMSGWMYYHINVFVTPIPHKVFNKNSKQYESKDKIINPPLRDSDVLIFESYEEVKRTKGKLFMFIAATRRAAKTTLESSKLGHAATIGKKELLCAGGSTKDLNQIAKNFRTDIQYKNPAFAVFNVSNDWKDKVEIGLKTKASKTILLSTLFIVNTADGNNVEILAGFTPDEFVYDEALKSKFIEALQGLKPALRGTDGLTRCYGLITCTGGDEELSKDGYIVLNDPESNSVLPMNWGLLERGVDPGYRTWEEDKVKPFGTFIPGQMCVDMPKYESTLGDYIGNTKSAKLKKIKLKVTDWKQATEKIHENREALRGNKIAYTKEVVYIPITPSEIFMSGKISPFPVNEAKAHRQYLIETGKWDRRRELFKDSNGKIHAKISKKELAKFPHKGGKCDAPLMLLEDLPETKPRYGLYTGGFDDVKQEDSDTDSLPSFVVWKNEVLGDPFSDKLVASLKFKPDRREEIYEQWLLLMEAFNLERTCFGENIDFEIKSYLDKFHLTDKYLATSLDFSTSFNIPNNQKRKFGWNPSTSKRLLFDMFVSYCNETFEVEQEDGSILILKGVQRIDDIGILDEIIAYNDNLNVDLITSAMGAYGYSSYLRTSYIWKVQSIKSQNIQEHEVNRQQRPDKQFYSHPTQRRGFYRRK